MDVPHDPVTAGFVDHVAHGTPDGGEVLLVGSAAWGPAVAATERVPRPVEPTADALAAVARRGGYPSAVAIGVPEIGALLAPLAATVSPHGLVYVTADPGEAIDADAAGLDVVEERDDGDTRHLLCRVRVPDAVTRDRESASVRTLVVGAAVAVALAFGILLIAGSFGTAGVVGAAALEAVLIAALWRWSPSA